MSVSVRSLLFPAVAVAAAGTVALSPVLVVAPGHSALAAASIVDVRTADVALAGIGQDIYYAITPTVQYVVGGVSYIINLVPIIGGVIAAQININYFQGIQPIVEATVNALAGAVQDPFAIVATLTTYATTLYDIGYNWVSAELQWAGLAPLPPLPPLPSASLPSASVGESAPRPAAARAAAAVEQPSVRDLRRTAKPVERPRRITLRKGNAPQSKIRTFLLHRPWVPLAQAAIQVCRQLQLPGPKSRIRTVREHPGTVHLRIQKPRRPQQRHFGGKWRRDSLVPLR